MIKVNEVPMESRGPEVDVHKEGATFAAFLRFCSPLLGCILALLLHGLLALILHWVLAWLLSLVHRSTLVALWYKVGLHPRLRRIIPTRLCRYIGDELGFPSTKASETPDEKRVGDNPTAAREP